MELTILISGQRVRPGQRECGTFELAVPRGAVRMVLITGPEGCRYEDSWHDLSLAPDSRFAVADRRGQVGLIDVDKSGLRAEPVFSSLRHGQCTRIVKRADCYRIARTAMAAHSAIRNNGGGSSQN